MGGWGRAVRAGGHHLLHGPPLRLVPAARLLVGPAPGGLAQLRGRQRPAGVKGSPDRFDFFGPVDP